MFTCSFFTVFGLFLIYFFEISKGIFFKQQKDKSSLLTEHEEVLNKTFVVGILYILVNMLPNRDIIWKFCFLQNIMKPRSKTTKDKLQKLTGYFSLTSLHRHLVLFHLILGKWNLDLNTITIVLFWNLQIRKIHFFVPFSVLHFFILFLFVQGLLSLSLLQFLSNLYINLDNRNFSRSFIYWTFSLVSKKTLLEIISLYLFY